MNSTYETRNLGGFLSSSTYLGRGICIGKTPDEKNAVIAYFISGRSVNSKNRVFEEKNDGIITKAFDESKLSDPSLIIYSPIRVANDITIVTNGDQTDTIYDYLSQGKSFEEALKTREFEPDAPNLTPRISGIVKCENNDFSYKMSILKSADKEGSKCNRFTYDYQSLAGIGHFITTYMGNGEPLPSFTGEPSRVSISDNIDEFSNSIWLSMPKEYRISLYVRYINLSDKTTKNRMFNVNQ